MSSQAKIAANRRNGCKSRGPRTVLGKSNASRNAMRHGLAAISRHNPACFPDIERMAKALCNDVSDPLLFEQSLVIAESEFILLRVRAERVAVFERMRDPEAISLAKPKFILDRAKAKFLAAKLTYAVLVQAKVRPPRKRGEAPQDAAKADTPAAIRPGFSSQSNRIALYDEFTAMQRALPELDRFTRYERRAWSRRKRAIRAFIDIKSSSAVGNDAVNSASSITES
jgi:hypothetical protein